jgi:hypothetical protein
MIGAGHDDAVTCANGVRAVPEQHVGATFQHDDEIDRIPVVQLGAGRVLVGRTPWFVVDDEPLDEARR